jgi:hypothetical protein
MSASSGRSESSAAAPPWPPGPLLLLLLLPTLTLTASFVMPADYACPGPAAPGV